MTLEIPAPSIRQPSRWRKAYDRFLRIRGEPREIALGFALGIVVGFTPFMGFHMAIAVIVAMIFRCNKIAAAMVVWFSNPITAPVVYGLTYVVGNWCMGGKAHAAVLEKLQCASVAEWIYAVPDILWTLLIGGIVVAIPFAGVGYVIALKSVTRFQASRKAAHRHASEIPAVEKDVHHPGIRNLEKHPDAGYSSVCITKVPSGTVVDRCARPGCVPPG